MTRSNSGWKVIDARVVYRTPHLTVEEWVVHHDSDPSGRIHKFQVVLGYDYVQVVGCTEDGQAVLIVIDRVAHGGSLEVVAGSIGEEQTPEQAAAEELLSETGWAAGRFVPLGTHVPQTDRFVSCTIGNDGAKRCYMFLALDLSLASQNLGETEKIRSVLVPWEVAVRAARTGETVPDVGLPIDDGGSRLILLLADGVLNG